MGPDFPGVWISVQHTASHRNATLSVFQGLSICQSCPVSPGLVDMTAPSYLKGPSHYNSQLTAKKKNQIRKFLIFFRPPQNEDQEQKFITISILVFASSIVPQHTKFSLSNFALSFKLELYPLHSVNRGFVIIKLNLI